VIFRPSTGTQSEKIFLKNFGTANGDGKEKTRTAPGALCCGKKKAPPKEERTGL